jgi:hypothetical protein
MESTRCVEFSGAPRGAVRVDFGGGMAFSAPLIALFFNTVSPGGLVGNVIIIPMTFMIVLTGCCTLLAAGFSDAAVLLFNHANRIFTQWVILFIEWLRDVPAAYAFIRAPEVRVLFFWYAGLCLGLAGPRRARVPGCILALMALLLWMGGAPGSSRGMCGWRDRETSVAFCPAQGEWVLAVVGNPYDLNRTMRRLRKDGVNHLQALVLSGSKVDADAISALCDAFPATQIWMHPRFRNIASADALKNTGAEICFAERVQCPTERGVVTLNIN